LGAIVGRDSRFHGIYADCWMVGLLLSTGIAGTADGLRIRCGEVVQQTQAFSFLIPFWALSIAFLRVARRPPIVPSDTSMMATRSLTTQGRGNTGFRSVATWQTEISAQPMIHPCANLSHAERDTSALNARKQ
jgi:hypothetical protein